jgi:hypothetical protein
MKEQPQRLFDLFALALPRGHGFGDRPPIEAWQTQDAMAYGVVTLQEAEEDYGTWRCSLASVWRPRDCGVVCLARSAP